MWTAIFIVLALFILAGMVVLVIFSDKQFHDKAEGIKVGMSEDQVMNLLEKDPESINYLKDGSYTWTYNRNSWGGWGMITYKTEITFDASGHVTFVTRSKSCDNTDSQK